jgi:GTPase SAR1 family protein
MGAAKQKTIIFLGLDNGGKTTILNHLLHEQKEDITPTPGIETERFTTEGINFTAYDCSGQTKYFNMKQEIFTLVNVRPSPGSSLRYRFE